MARGAGEDDRTSNYDRNNLKPPLSAPEFADKRPALRLSPTESTNLLRPCSMVKKPNPSSVLFNLDECLGGEFVENCPTNEKKLLVLPSTSELSSGALKWAEKALNGANAGRRVANRRKRKGARFVSILFPDSIQISPRTAVDYWNGQSFQYKDVSVLPDKDEDAVKRMCPDVSVCDSQYCNGDRVFDVKHECQDVLHQEGQTSCNVETENESINADASAHPVDTGKVTLQLIPYYCNVAIETYVFNAPVTLAIQCALTIMLSRIDFILAKCDVRHIITTCICDWAVTEPENLTLDDVYHAWEDELTNKPVVDERHREIRIQTPSRRKLNELKTAFEAQSAILLPTEKPIGVLPVCNCLSNVPCVIDLPQIKDVSQDILAAEHNLRGGGDVNGKVKPVTVTKSQTMMPQETAAATNPDSTTRTPSITDSQRSDSESVSLCSRTDTTYDSPRHECDSIAASSVAVRSSQSQVSSDMETPTIEFMQTTSDSLQYGRYSELRSVDTVYLESPSTTDSSCDNSLSPRTLPADSILMAQREFAVTPRVNESNQTLYLNLNQLHSPRSQNGESNETLYINIRQLVACMSTQVSPRGSESPCESEQKSKGVDHSSQENMLQITEISEEASESINDSLHIQVVEESDMTAKPNGDMPVELSLPEGFAVFGTYTGSTPAICPTLPGLFNVEETPNDNLHVQVVELSNVATEPVKETPAEWSLPAGFAVFGTSTGSSPAICPTLTGLFNPFTAVMENQQQASDSSNLPTDTYNTLADWDRYSDIYSESPDADVSNVDGRKFHNAETFYIVDVNKSQETHTPYIKVYQFQDSDSDSINSTNSEHMNESDYNNIKAYLFQDGDKSILQIYPHESSSSSSSRSDTSGVTVHAHQIADTNEGVQVHPCKEKHSNFATTSDTKRLLVDSLHVAETNSAHMCPCRDQDSSSLVYLSATSDTNSVLVDSLQVTETNSSLVCPCRDQDSSSLVYLSATSDTNSVLVDSLQVAETDSSLVCPCHDQDSTSLVYLSATSDTNNILADALHVAESTSTHVCPCQDQDSSCLMYPSATSETNSVFVDALQAAVYPCQDKDSISLELYLSDTNDTNSELQVAEAINAQVCSCQNKDSTNLEVNLSDTNVINSVLMDVLQVAEAISAQVCQYQNKDSKNLSTDINDNSVLVDVLQFVEDINAQVCQDKNSTSSEVYPSDTINSKIVVVDELVVAEANITQVCQDKDSTSLEVYLSDTSDSKSVVVDELDVEATQDKDSTILEVYLHDLYDTSCVPVHISLISDANTVHECSSQDTDGNVEVCLCRDNDTRSLEAYTHDNTNDTNSVPINVHVHPYQGTDDNVEVGLCQDVHGTSGNNSVHVHDANSIPMHAYLITDADTVHLYPWQDTDSSVEVCPQQEKDKSSLDVCLHVTNDTNSIPTHISMVADASSLHVHPCHSTDDNVEVCSYRDTDDVEVFACEVKTISENHPYVTSDANSIPGHAYQVAGASSIQLHQYQDMATGSANVYPYYDSDNNVIRHVTEDMNVTARTYLVPDANNVHVYYPHHNIEPNSVYLHSNQDITANSVSMYSFQDSDATNVEVYPCQDTSMSNFQVYPHYTSDTNSVPVHLYQDGYFSMVHVFDWQNTNSNVRIIPQQAIDAISVQEVDANDSYQDADAISLHMYPYQITEANSVQVCSYIDIDDNVDMYQCHETSNSDISSIAMSDRSNSSCVCVRSDVYFPKTATSDANVVLIQCVSSTESTSSMEQIQLIELRADVSMESITPSNDLICNPIYLNLQEWDGSDTTTQIPESSVHDILSRRMKFDPFIETPRFIIELGVKSQSLLSTSDTYSPRDSSTIETQSYTSGLSTSLSSEHLNSKTTPSTSSIPSTVSTAGRGSSDSWGCFTPRFHAILENRDRPSCQPLMDTELLSTTSVTSTVKSREPRNHCGLTSCVHRLTCVTSAREVVDILHAVWDLRAQVRTSFLSMQPNRLQVTLSSGFCMDPTETTSLMKMPDTNPLQVTVEEPNRGLSNRFSLLNRFIPFQLPLFRCRFANSQPNHIVLSRSEVTNCLDNEELEKELDYGEPEGNLPIILDPSRIKFMDERTRNIQRLVKIGLQARCAH